MSRLENINCINRTFGLSSRIVIELTKFLEKKGYVIFTENFYTSPQLTDYLFSRDTYLCGTVRTNWKGFPKPLLNLKLNKGEFKEVIFIGLCVGLCLRLFWKDNRIVYYLSTFHAPEDGQLRTNQNRWDTKRFNRLADSKAYPQYIGGVDRLDQITRVDKEKKAWGGT